MDGSTVIHPDWCHIQQCRVGTPGAAYAWHRSSPVSGCADPDTGSLVDVSLWQIRPGHVNVLLEFPDGIEEGTELTADQAEQLAATMTRLVASARG
ncbi:hypothetical protein AB0K00_36740 [Dactylosporangium sp. NPDC049525]|uniref:DUF6907 domain-containing protein n=1 Tax=Dactylosporangium sp. NPDC049525 TaxID=3154730 RepID=UPI0034178B38